MGRVASGYSPNWNPQPEKGMTPSDEWARFRLARERAGAPGSDFANYARLIRDQGRAEFKQKFDIFKVAFDEVQERIADAGSVAEKEIYYEQAKGMLSSIPENERGIFNAMVPINPKLARDLKMIEYTKNNPRPLPFDPEMIDLDPASAAQRFHSIALWDKNKAEAVDGIDIEVPSIQRMNEKFYSVDGKAVAKETLDPFLKEYAKANDTTPLAIVASGGFGPVKTFQDQIVDPETGQVKTVTFGYRTKVADGSTKVIKLREDKAPGKTSAPFQLPPGTKVGPINPALGWAAMNGLVSENQLSQETKSWVGVLKKGQELFADDAEGYKLFVANSAQVYENYTLLMQTKEDEIKESQQSLFSPKSWIYPKIDVGKGSSLKKVPGKPRMFALADGNTAWVVVDEANGTVHDADGVWLNQFFPDKSADEIVKFYQGKTTEEIVKWESEYLRRK